MNSCVKNFSIYLETAGNAVPKTDTVRRFIDYLAVFGYNRFYLGCADTFRIEGEPYFGYMRGAYTAEELCDIDGYCKSKNITFVVNTQTLAHQKCIPAYERFKKIIDIQDTLLADNDETYEFIEEMIATLSKCLSSKTIHLGMDEAFCLGGGKYYKTHKKVDRKEIFLKHLIRVCKIAEKYGLTCEIWGDMFFYSLSDGEADDKTVLENLRRNIPENLKIVCWSYLNSDKEYIKQLLIKNKRISSNLALARTLFNWTGFVPDNENSVRNFGNVVSACDGTGVNDIMLTMWSDSGGDGSIFSVLPAMYACSQIYQGKASSIETIDKEPFYKATGISFDDFMLLDKLNKPYDGKSYESVNNKTFIYLYNDPFIGLFDSMLSDGLARAFSGVSERLKAVDGGQFQYVFDTVIALADALCIKCDLGKRIRENYLKANRSELKRIADKEIPKLSELLYILFDKLSAQWERELKPFGLEVQTARIGTLLLRLKHVAKKLGDYSAGRISAIEELEEKQEKFGYRSNATEDDYFLMCWVNIFTSGHCV